MKSNISKLLKNKAYLIKGVGDLGIALEVLRTLVLWWLWAG